MKNQRIRKHLLQRRHDLLARYHSELDRAEEELDSRDHEAVENATELWDARILLLLGEADARRLSEIVSAIRRVDEGCYGKCVKCRSAIATARLAAMPEAASCFKCALSLEQPAIRLAL